MRVTCYCLCIDSQLIRNVVCLSDILRVLVQDLLFLFLIFIFRSLGYSPFSCTPSYAPYIAILEYIIPVSIEYLTLKVCGKKNTYYRTARDDI